VVPAAEVVIGRIVTTLDSNGNGSANSMNSSSMPGPAGTATSALLLALSSGRVCGGVHPQPAAARVRPKLHGFAACGYLAVNVSIAHNASQVLGDRGAAAELRPTERGAAVDRVADVEARAAAD